MLSESLLKQYNDNSVFPNILVLFEYLKARGWVGLAHSGPCFECMQLYGDRLAAAPMPMNPLYRGESEFHPVCKPNVFRKEWTEAERLEMEILTNSPLVAAFFATTEYDGVEAARGTEGIWD